MHTYKNTFIYSALLLQYGADPSIRNNQGKTPPENLPRDAVKSTKLFFKKIFDVRAHKICMTTTYKIICHYCYSHHHNSFRFTGSTSKDTSRSNGRISCHVKQ